MWAETRAKIVDVITAGISGVVAVTAYPTSSESGYPTINVIGADAASTFGTGAPANQNVQTAVYTVRVLFSITDDREQTAESTLDAVLDQLVVLFTNPDVLAPACEWVEPVSATWGYQDRANGQVRIVDMQIRCNKLY